MGAGQGDSYSSYRQQRHVNASDVFACLRKKAKEIADEESHAMANSMKHVLVNRLSLGPGNGNFPRYNPNLPRANGKRRGGKSKKMFSTWKVQPRNNGEYWLYTDGIDPEHENYSKQLISGKGWSPRVANGKLKYLVRKGDKLFSTQMPNGLEPWLIDKRQLLIDKIKKRMSEDHGC